MFSSHLILTFPLRNFRSVLRSRNNSFDGSALLNENSSLENSSTIVINFNQLCDDIYICDWI